jgi:HK97 family phage prohead protease
VELESKQARVEAKAMDDAEGTVQAVVSVTNIVDSVKDVIQPGAYAMTLGKRVPKGVWSHDTTIPIAKTLAAIELEPGDSRLPKHLRDVDAGGVLVKMKFNLNTTRGREAYEDIKFFGGEQEWSIGYSVPEGGSEMKEDTGIRYIKQLEWYEYSPVLFGAAPGTRTVSVKEDPTLEFDKADLISDSIGSTETFDVEPDDVKGPTARHKTGVKAEDWYDKTAYRNMRSPAPAGKAYFGKIFAFHIDGEDPKMKTNYTFVHHFVGSDGRPGPAALSALQNTFGLLNGARMGTKLRGSDRKGVYNHIAGHYRDDGKKPPELKTDGYIDAVMELKERLPESFCGEVDALIEKGAELFEIKSSLEDVMADEAENTETTEVEVESNGPTAQSVIQDAIVALNTLSESLVDLEEKAGDTAGFSNSAPDSAERTEGAGEAAPEVVADLSHGGVLTPEEMTVEGSPAGGDVPAPKVVKAPKAKDPEPDDSEKAAEAVEEEASDEPTEGGLLGELDLKEIREFQDLVTFSDLGE